MATVRARDARPSTSGGVDPIELVTHELTTPLAVITGAVESLIEHHDQLEPAQRMALLQAIRRHGQLAAALLQRLGVLRELEWGELTLDLAPVDLTAVVCDLVRDLTGLTDPPPIIEVDADRPVVVRADRQAVEEILVILLSNALRHGDNSPIRVAVWTDDGTATIRVRDHGPGVDPLDADRIFDSYERGAARGPGAGIGLTVGRGLAQAHGGTLRLDQPPAGGGCVFRLTLQVAGPRPDA